MTVNGLCLVVTDKCNAACDICCFSCSPEKGSVMDAHLMADVIDQAEGIDGLKYIGFSGGEPFLYYDLIRDGLARAKAKGFATSVATNGFWGAWPDDVLFKRLSALAARPLAQLKAIGFLPEATLLRVELDGGGREVYSLLRNRAHSNVAFILGESLRYQPEKDTLTLYPEVLSSYPNFLFSLREGEVGAFVASLQQAEAAEDFERIVQRWGVRRSDPRFWSLFHDLAAHIRETQPVEAGVLDMNRYQNL